MSALIDPAVVNVPACANHISAADYNANRAAAFDPRDSDYLKSLVPSAAGGFALGSVSIACACLLAIWLLLGARKGRTWKHELQQLHNGSPRCYGISSTRCNVQLVDLSAAKQRKDIEDVDGTTDSDTALHGWHRRMFIIWTAVAAVVCLWALVESALSANSAADKFWRVVDTAIGQVQLILDTTQTLLQDAKSIRSAFLILWLRTVAGKASLPAGTPANATELLQSSAKSFEPVILTAEASAARIRTNGIEALQQFEDEFQGSTERMQTVGLPIILAVFYGILGVGCVLAGWLALKGRRPRVTGWLTVALWLLSALVLLLGAGVFNSGRTVTKDACLYAESLAFSLAAEQPDEDTRNQLRLGLRYYFGKANLPIYLVGGLIYGLDFDNIRSTLRTEGIKQMTEFLATDAGKQLVATGKFNQTGTRLVDALPGNIKELSTSVDALSNAVNVATFGQLYQRAKELLCCEWTDDAHTLFISWTLAGVVVILLCAAVSVRVHSLVSRPGQSGNLLTRFVKYFR